MKKRSNLLKKVKSIRWRKEYKMPLIAAGMVATAALIAFVTTSATYSGASSGSIGSGAVGSIGLVSGGGGATRYPLVHGATIGVSVGNKSLADIMTFKSHDKHDDEGNYNTYFGVTDDKDKKRLVRSWHRTDGARSGNQEDKGDGTYAFSATAMDEIARTYYAENLQPWDKSTTVYTYINKSYGRPNIKEGGIHFMDGSEMKRSNDGGSKSGPIINTSDYDEDFSKNHLISLDKGFATKGKKDAVVKATRDSLNGKKGYYYQAIKTLMNEFVKKKKKSKISDLDHGDAKDLRYYLTPERIEKKAGKIKSRRAEAQKLFLTAAGTYKKGNSFVVLGQGVLDGYLLETTENTIKELNVPEALKKNLTLERINKYLGNQDRIVNRDLAEFNAYYAMHYIDLLMCGYEQCNNGTAKRSDIINTQREWKNAIEAYLNVIATGSNYDQEMPYIFLTAGTVGVNNRTIEVTDGYTLATARMGLNAKDGSMHHGIDQGTTLRSGFIGFPVYETKTSKKAKYQTKKGGKTLFGTSNKNIKTSKENHKWRIIKQGKKGKPEEKHGTAKYTKAPVSAVKSPFLLNNTYEKIIETSKKVNGSGKPDASKSNSWHTTALLATVMDHTKVSQHVGSAGAQQGEQLMKLLHFTNEVGNKTSQIYGTNVIFPPRVMKWSGKKKEKEDSAFEMRIFSEKVKGSRGAKEENEKTKYVGVNSDANNVGSMPILNDTNKDLMPPSPTDIKYKEIDFTRSVKTGENVAKKWQVNDKVHIKIDVPMEDAPVQRLWENIGTYPGNYKIFVVFESKQNSAYSGDYKTTMTSSKTDDSTFNGKPAKTGALKNVTKVCEIDTKAKGFSDGILATDFSVEAFKGTKTYLNPGQSLYENFNAQIVIFKKANKEGTKWKTITAGNAKSNKSFSKQELASATKAGLAGTFAKTNDVTAVYHYKKGNIPTPNPEDGFEFVKTGEISNYASAASHGYTELKEGSIYNETFEAMAGVPTTRTLYYTTGGEEFIVNLQAVYDDYKAKKPSDYKTVRKYKVIYAATDCEFKEGDALKPCASKQTLTETFVADAHDKNQTKSVKAEGNNAVDGSQYGASSGNANVSGHESDTKFWAQWTGTIANNTPEPGDIGSFNPGAPGSPCAGNGFNKGTQRKKGTAATNWDVSDYNKAVADALRYDTVRFTALRVWKLDVCWGLLAEFLCL